MDTNQPFRSGDVGLQLSGSVASHLREQIISGKLKPGDFLRIDSIASEMGVSTTPVREGLLLLQSESFVRLLPRRGFQVNSFSRGDLRDIFWAQAIVGGELAARAAEKMSKEEVARLQQLVAEHQAAFNGNDEARTVRLGHEFHRHINLSAASPRLALLLGSLAKQLPNRFYASIEGQMAETLEYHPIIAGAIRMKDAEAARSLMHRHIMSGAEHLIQMLERNGAWAGAEATAAAPASAPAEPVDPPAKAKAGRPKKDAAVPARTVRAAKKQVAGRRAAR